MYSPALITYSFYLDNSNKDLRFKGLRSVDERNKCTNEKLLNLSRNVSAFNFTFGGDSVSVPQADTEDVCYADCLRSQKGIDAYMAGMKNGDGKSDWYYSGHFLAICLILSESKNISISRDERLKSIEIIQEDDLGDQEFKGFISSSFSSVIDGHRYSFKYLNDLKHKVEKLGRRKLFGIF